MTTHLNRLESVVNMPSSSIKKILATLLYKSGLFAVRSSLVMKNKAIVLMYHRVLPRELVGQAATPVQPGMFVTPRSLQLHLAYLKTNFSPVSLGELVRRIKADEDISRCVVLTFDDGWLDNYLYAYPILQEFKIPATIFLSTGLIGTSHWFWPEEIGWVVRSVYSKQIAVSELPPPLSDILKKEMVLANGVENSIEHIVKTMKSWGESQKSAVAKNCAQLRQSLSDTSERLLMNWQEVREMASSGIVNFGSHTVSHALLDKLSTEQIQWELAESIAQAQGQTNTAVEFFAYPNGNYSQKALSIVSASGVKAAVSTRRDYVLSSSPMFELPRIGIHEDVSHTVALLQWRLFVK